jgi:hypothetical protein
VRHDAGPALLVGAIRTHARPEAARSQLPPRSHGQFLAQYRAELEAANRRLSDRPVMTGRAVTQFNNVMDDEIICYAFMQKVHGRSQITQFGA